MTVISSIKLGLSNSQPLISEAMSLPSLLFITGQNDPNSIIIGDYINTIYGSYLGSYISIQEFLYSIFYLPPPFNIKIGYFPFSIQEFVIDNLYIREQSLFLSIKENVTKCGNTSNVSLLDIPITSIYFVSDYKNNTFTSL
jgi:hypothetical protein